MTQIDGLFNRVKTKKRRAFRFALLCAQGGALGPDGYLNALLQSTRGAGTDAPERWLSAVSMGGGLACCPCCPFPLGFSIYRVERVDAGDLVDSKNRQQTCGFGANRMKSKKGT
jgi:hypothetical protein